MGQGKSVMWTERLRCRQTPLCCGAALALSIILSCIAGPCKSVHIFASQPESAPASDFHYRKSSFAPQCVVIIGRHHVVVQLDLRPPSTIYSITASAFLICPRLPIVDVVYVHQLLQRLHHLHHDSTKTSFAYQDPPISTILAS